MALNYTVYKYDGSRNAVVMTDMDGKQLVIDCDKAETQVCLLYTSPSPRDTR